MTAPDCPGRGRPGTAADDRGGEGPVDAAAERFARAWQAVQSGAAVDDVVTAFADDAELAELLRLADAAARVLPATVDTATRDRQRTLLAAMPTAAGRGPRGRAAAAPLARRRWAWPQLALRLGAAVVAASLGLGSTVVVAADDLPGDPLYGVKRAAESARLAITFDPARRAALHIELAHLRLSEIRALIDRGDNPPAAVVEALLEELTSAQAAAGDAAEPSLVEGAASARRDAADGLRALADRSPAAAHLLGGAADSLAPRAAPAPSVPQPGDAGPRSAPPRPEAPPRAATPTADAGASGPPREAGASPATAAPALPSATAPATAAPGVPAPADEPPAPAPAEATAAPPAATDAPADPAPPHDPAPTTAPENPRANERATDLAERPPPPTRQPQRTPRRP